MCESGLFLGNYLTYITIPPIVILLLLGTIILLSDFKKNVNRFYFLINLFIVFWILANALSFKFESPELVNWADRLSAVGLIAAALTVVFIYIFPENLKINKKILTFIFAPLLPFLIIVPTNLYIENTGPFPKCETVVGKMFWLQIFLILYYILFGFFIARKKFKYLVGIQREQFKYFTFGLITMLFFGVFIDIIPTIFGGEDIILFTPYTTIIFAAACAYAIVKYEAMNAKIISTQIFVALMCIIIFSEFFFVESFINMVLVGITFLLSIFFGYMLIKSVKLEVQRKEELQMMADKLASANDQLRKLDNAKTEFISIASHQLRTPLTSVKGFVSLIIEGSYGEVNSQVKEALVKVYSSAERLIQLVEDLLNISRIESGRMQYTFEKADISKVLQEIHDNFVLVAKNKKMFLDLKMPKKLPELKMDSGKIREVVSNLVDNAFKYTKRGGVTIKAETVGKNVVRLTVSDTGIGIPKEEVQNLFKKFSRGKDQKRLHASGTGLGLFVGKNIIDAHHGKIWIESEGEGKGSRFIVELPVDFVE